MHLDSEYDTLKQNLRLFDASVVRKKKSDLSQAIALKNTVDSFFETKSVASKKKEK